MYDLDKLRTNGKRRYVLRRHTLDLFNMNSLHYHGFLFPGLHIDYWDAFTVLNQNLTVSSDTDYESDEDESDPGSGSDIDRELLQDQW